VVQQWFTARKKTKVNPFRKKTGKKIEKCFFSKNSSKSLPKKTLIRQDKLSLSFHLFFLNGRDEKKAQAVVIELWSFSFYLNKRCASNFFWTFFLKKF
jgi:hypothetical protein